MFSTLKLFKSNFLLIIQTSKIHLNFRTQYNSLDDLYNFIVSDNDKNKTKNGCRGLSKNIDEIPKEIEEVTKKKITKKKIIKKKIVRVKNELCQLSEEDQVVENFKKFILESQTNSNKRVNKIRPFFTQEWLETVSQ